MEFDEDGYHLWESWHNVKVAVGLTTLVGMFFIIALSTVAAV